MRVRAKAESALASTDPAAHREALADVLEETDRVESMLNTLMDISEAETGTMRLNISSVNVAEAVNEAVELYEDTAEDAGLTLTAQIPDGLSISADRDRLRQALANLVDNAIKYTPSGGRVEITADRESDAVALRIRDTGRGISEQDLPRIWDRLYRGDQSRATRGLGLGLSLVRAYVEAQGGKVSVESAADRGSTFTIRLPRNITAL
jgi:signal transduction histidine kinase